MTLIIGERVDSREATEGVENPSAALKYVVHRTEDDAAVRSAVEAILPSTYRGLVFQEYQLSPQEGGVWEVTARYGKFEPVEPQPPQEQPPTGGSSFSFDTGGGTQHITQSLQTVHKYAPSGKTAPDFKGAIGVAGDSVDGCDVTVPVYSFTETHYLPVAVVTGAYKAALFALTGRVNGGAFKGFAAGEVLFLGASGSQRGADDWEITFRFAASPNVTGLSIGDISGIAKQGWEYLWVRYADAVDEHQLIKRPVAVYIERVYESGDFSALGIGA